MPKLSLFNLYSYVKQLEKQKNECSDKYKLSHHLLEFLEKKEWSNEITKAALLLAYSYNQQLEFQSVFVSLFYLKPSPSDEMWRLIDLHPSLNFNAPKLKSLLTHPAYSFFVNEGVPASLPTKSWYQSQRLHHIIHALYQQLLSIEEQSTNKKQSSLDQLNDKKLNLPKVSLFSSANERETFFLLVPWHPLYSVEEKLWLNLSTEQSANLRLIEDDFADINSNIVGLPLFQGQRCAFDQDFNLIELMRRINNHLSRSNYQVGQSRSEATDIENQHAHAQFKLIVKLTLSSSCLTPKKISEKDWAIKNNSRLLDANSTPYFIVKKGTQVKVSDILEVSMMYPHEYHQAGLMPELNIDEPYRLVLTRWPYHHIVGSNESLQFDEKAIQEENKFMASNPLYATITELVDRPVISLKQ